MHADLSRIVHSEDGYRRRSGAIVELQIEYQAARHAPPEPKPQFMIEVRQDAQIQLLAARRNDYEHDCRISAPISADFAHESIRLASGSAV